MRLKLRQDTGDLIVGEMIADGDAEVGAPLIVAVAGPKQVTLQPRTKTTPKKGSEEGQTKTLLLLDEKIFPGLKQANNLEIREANTGTVLYRRFTSSHQLDAKVFWYSLSPMPDEPLEAIAKQYFGTIHTGVERLTTPELTSLIADKSAASVFMTGRPPLRQHLELLKANNFRIVTLLREPYEELAERIAFLNLITTKQMVADFSERLSELRPLLKLSKMIDVRDPKSSLDVFSKLRKPQRLALLNPLTVALGCNPSEVPSSRHIATALDSLGAMDLVGLRSRFDDFKASLAEFLDTDILEDYRLSRVIDETAAQLRKIRQFESMISLDLELYAHASEAIEEALSAVTELDAETVES